MGWEALQNTSFWDVNVCAKSTSSICHTLNHTLKTGSNVIQTLKPKAQSPNPKPS